MRRYADLVDFVPALAALDIGRTTNSLMGNFYTNIVLGDKDADAVAVSMAAMNRRAYVARTTLGTIVFDERCDTQDLEELERLARELSRRHGPALAVCNHDDDVLWYALADGGRVLDRYNSFPALFDEDTDEPTGGDGTHLCESFGATARTAEVPYTGDNPILIALWADWAHIWDVATGGIVAQLEHEFAGRCDFAYIEATNRTVRNAYGAHVVPTLILRHHGADIERFVNVLKPDDVRSSIAGAVAKPGATPDRDGGSTARSRTFTIS